MSSTRNDFPLVEWAISQNRQLLVTARICMSASVASLGYLFILAIVVHRLRKIAAMVK